MKRVRYGLREIASKGRRECMDSRRIDVSEELGCYTEKSQARFVALPVGEKSRLGFFDFFRHYGVCVSVGHRRSGGWGCLTSVVANFDFVFRISRHCFDQAFCG
ncbi:hypothetical protein F2Q68_00005251 [Brassica cretica]|uniref:Uncharacterized protein n=1 Tax=Brassica cretica TaxID=69181 RepID=A0A8S9JEN0_BRACR|nr:hypothetical protein F2Q68_00005251 [Brassica cretica]